VAKMFEQVLQRKYGINSYFRSCINILKSLKNSQSEIYE